MAIGAIDIHKYYGGSGSFADRRKTWEDLGLGSAAEYQDTATQNAQLVSAMNANKGLKLASQSASPAETPAANTAAAASSSSSAQPTAASYASQSEAIANQLKQLYQQPFEYDATSDPVWQYLAQRREALGGNPVDFDAAWRDYLAARAEKGAYDDKSAALLEQYLAQRNAMGPFKYDYASDPMYQQYARQYTNAGKRAMEDTLAQVSARTGGLASSYAGGAAQQAYNKYMTDLDNIVPQLEQIAYSRYRDRQSDLLNDYNLQMQQNELGYSKYRDDLNDLANDFSMRNSLDSQKYNAWRNDLSDIENDASLLYQLGNNAYSRYSDEWNRNYQTGRDAIANQQWQDTFNYNKEQDAIANALNQSKFDATILEDNYNRLASLIALGHTPTDAELASAGMTRAEANSMANYYAQQAAAKAKDSSGSNPSPKKDTSSKESAYDTVSKMKGDDNAKIKRLESFVNDGTVTADDAVEIAGWLGINLEEEDAASKEIAALREKVRRGEMNAAAAEELIRRKYGVGGTNWFTR